MLKLSAVIVAVKTFCTDDDDVALLKPSEAIFFNKKLCSDEASPAASFLILCESQAASAIVFVFARAIVCDENFKLKLIESETALSKFTKLTKRPSRKFLNYRLQKNFIAIVYIFVFKISHRVHRINKPGE